LDLIGDGVQEGGTFFARAVAIGPKGLFGGLRGAVNQLDRAHREMVGLPPCGLIAECLIRGDPFAGDQMPAMRSERHFLPFLEFWRVSRNSEPGWRRWPRR